MITQYVNSPSTEINLGNIIERTKTNPLCYIFHTLAERIAIRHIR